jgi:hypothetical protein
MVSMFVINKKLVFGNVIGQISQEERSDVANQGYKSIE